ncbi:uncharacterized protein LOC119390999 isoform X7 [Rhipicephalus sanguineus]|nr:uncharacterized protein LOC119390999 isoform X6 [Rhipicephalus sanguineus]XP_049270971.1 uncharacterized protein LOC119390999 isoform X7 [Rhipicephalus sanguineus]
MLGALHMLEAANSFTELQSHGSSHIPVSSTLAVAVWPHMEPSMLDTSYSPGPAYLTGATRSQTDPQVLAFMERILHVLNSMKHTQQAHSQYFNELLSNADSAAPHPHGLPDLPFSNVADVLAYGEKLETDSKAHDQMKKHMAVQGGDSTKLKTTRVLQSLLSWNAAVGFSWFGTKGKKIL